MDKDKEIIKLKKELETLGNIIGGHSVFVVSRKWDDREIFATIYRRGEGPDGSFIRLVVDIDDFGEMVKAELSNGATVEQALDAVLKGAKYASREVIKQ